LLPFVRPVGRFSSDEEHGQRRELSEAAAAAPFGRKLLRCATTHTGHRIVHRAVLVEKIAPTPDGYPRRWAKIQKAPL
jgi:16S rRNA (guanine527-N7)-methyltransferase